MRGDLGTLGEILGATLGGVREMSLLFKIKEINLEKLGGMSDTWTTENV